MSNKGEEAFVAFCQRFGNEVGNDILTQISDVAWGGKADGVTISDTHQINACNHIHSGTVEHAGETFSFIIESGDRNGTVIEQWCSPDDAEPFDPPKPTIYTFVPRDGLLKQDRQAMYDVYLLWTQEQWFQDQVKAYNYDNHFAPGGKTSKHYREWAEKKGLKITIKSEEDGQWKAIAADLREKFGAKAVV